MGVETKQDALVNLPEENINEYKGKAFVAQQRSSGNKRPKKDTKTTTKTKKTAKTYTGDMIHDMDIDMVDNNDMQTTATTAPAQSDIKMNDSVSAIGSILSVQRDEDELVKQLTVI